jgi:hypothetical protein
MYFVMIDGLHTTTLFTQNNTHGQRVESPIMRLADGKLVYLSYSGYNNAIGIFNVDDGYMATNINSGIVITKIGSIS